MIVISMIQNVCNEEMDEINEKVVDLPGRWNESKREGGRGRKRITK